MKRIRILFIAVLVLAFAVLTGCSANDGNVSDDNNMSDSLMTGPSAEQTDDASNGLLSTDSAGARQSAPTSDSAAFR